MSRTEAREYSPLQLRLLQLLRNRLYHVTDLFALFPGRTLAVAMALQALREAGLVRRTTDGVYRITRKAA